MIPVYLNVISLAITVITVLMTARKNAEQSAMQTGEILEKLKTLEKSSDALTLKVEKNSEKIAELDSRVSRMEGQNEN